MKCLSLWQPWASLVVLGAKWIETRSWPTQHRGPLAIHAAKKWEDRMRRLCLSEPFFSTLIAAGAIRDTGRTLEIVLPRGCILGTVNVDDCLPIACKPLPAGVRCVGLDDEGIVRLWFPSSPAKGVQGHVGDIQLNEHEQAFGDYSPGRFAWLLSNPVMLAQPIPCRGGRRLFEVSELGQEPTR